MFCFHYKALHSNFKVTQYLFELILNKPTSSASRIADNIPLFKIKHIFFKNYFLPYTIIERSKLDSTLRNLVSKYFQNSLNAKIIRGLLNSTPSRSALGDLQSVELLVPWLKGPLLALSLLDCFYFLRYWAIYLL